VDRTTQAGSVAGASPPTERPPRCPETGHTKRRGYVTAKFGVQPTAAGPRQKYRCTARDGSVHYFVAAATSSVGARPAEEPKERHHRRKHDVACPRRAHAQRNVRYKGTRTTAAGVTWGKFQCVPVAGKGKSHYFSVLRSVTGAAISTLDNPPSCSDHELSAVVRNGRHGRPGIVRKQSYRCTPADGSPAHYFMTPLPREEVHAGVETCSVCDELLSPHRGALSGARHTSWTMKNLAQALNDLSTGSSYATVSMEMRQRREAARKHLESHRRGHDDPAALSEDAPESKSQSWTAEQSKNSWHLAADLVEQYSHLFFDKVNADMLAREAKLRAGNDALLATNPDARLASPIVYVLDEQPIAVHRRQSTKSGHQRNSWSVLVVVELIWHRKPPEPGDEHPANFPRTTREARLRMVRAYPAGSELAWRLVLDEVGTRPDFIVSDCAPVILNAVNSHYGKGVVAHIPSLFHIHQNVRLALMKLPGASEMVDDRRVLIPALSKHLDYLRRDEVLNLAPRDWKRWWDDLIAMVKALPASDTSIRDRRTVYEARVAGALPLLRKQPQLPASNAAVEAQIRLTLEPFTGSGRAHRYRNLGRTNALLSLAVCRSQGGLGDMDNISRVIRTDNENAGGWSPLPRAINDAQPPPSMHPAAVGKPPDDEVAGVKKKARRGGAQAYSSLLNPFLIPLLAKQRGVT
jgi:hypothetical protein